jgi:hypothetical protein
VKIKKTCIIEQKPKEVYGIYSTTEAIPDYRVIQLQPIFVAFVMYQHPKDQHGNALMRTQ